MNSARGWTLRLLILFGLIGLFESHRRPAASAGKLRATAPRAQTASAQAGSLLVFDNDEDGYRAWIAANSHGYVLNTPKAHGSTADILHRANCSSISSPRIPNYTTTDFKKITALNKSELVAWLNQNSEDRCLCGRCKP